MHDSWRPKLWSRGYARSSLMGKEPTMNPSPAAAFLLGMTVKRPKVHQIGHAARAILGRRRRPRTSNPIPAALAVLGGLGGISKRFRASSDKRAATIAPQLVAIANGGNLNVAKALIDRSNHPMNAKEHAIWENAQSQLSPQVLKAVGQYIDQLGSADQGSPELFTQSVQALPVITLRDLKEAEAEQARQLKAERGAAAAGREAAAERREARLTELGAAGLSAIARGARRQPRRRRKRRSQGRTFSF